MTKKIAIVGRPNVGKSTLFNRLTGTRKAITSDLSGTTRDRHYGTCMWDDKQFIIIDTGGYNSNANDNIENEINAQIEIAINEANTILFLVDCHEGLTDKDKVFAEKLRRLHKEVIVIANKADNINYEINGYEFIKLGFGEPVHICANNGTGTDNLLDILTKDIENKKEEINENNENIENETNNNCNLYKENYTLSEHDDDPLLDNCPEDAKKNDDDTNIDAEEDNFNDDDDNLLDNIKDCNNTHIPRIAIIGKPNAGKSSLLNTLLGEQKMIVDSRAGTTRDAVDSFYNRYGYKLILVDTAGLRRKSREKENIEFYSSLRSIQELEGCDICLYVIDGTIGVCKQDIALLNLAIRRGKGIVILINKIDIFETKQELMKEFKNKIKRELRHLSFIPVLYVSAIQKKNIFRAMEKVKEVYKNKIQRISTPKLNNIILPIIKHRQPMSSSGQEIKIKYITQLPTQNIIIAFFCNNIKCIKNDYKRFLETKLRENFNLEGVPIKLVFKDKENNEQNS